jgi:hypothetical protein
MRCRGGRCWGRVGIGRLVGGQLVGGRVVGGRVTVEPKIYPNWVFGLKINHLATLVLRGGSTGIFCLQFISFSEQKEKLMARKEELDRGYKKIQASVQNKINFTISAIFCL